MAQPICHRFLHFAYCRIWRGVQPVQRQIEKKANRQRVKPRCVRLRVKRFFRDGRARITQWPVPNTLSSPTPITFARGQTYWKRFQTTRLNAPESALAEAIVFRVLQYCKVDPLVVDKPNVGGPDFSCLQGKPQEFMVEATSLLPQRVTEKSNIPNRVPEDLEGGPFGLLLVGELRIGRLKKSFSMPENTIFQKFARYKRIQETVRELVT